CWWRAASPGSNAVRPARTAGSSSRSRPRTSRRSPRCSCSSGRTWRRSNRRACARTSCVVWKRSSMPERKRTPTTAERLGRMLVIVPYLVQHPGTSLEAASTIFEVPQDQLRRDLDLLFMSGLPPYGPGDLIDVDVDEDGNVWISMADHFARPLRLPRPEALAASRRAAAL